MALFKFPFRPIWMLIPMLALLASALISIAVYGSIPRLPAGLKVEDWAVGGMNYGEFERQLAEKKARSLERPIALTVSGGIGAGTQVRTLQRLGLHTEEGQIQRRLRQLREGSPFRRAVNRWKARSGVWAWPRGIADEPLQAALQQAFPQVYARRPVNAKRIFTENDTISYTAEMPVERVDENKCGNSWSCCSPRGARPSGAPAFRYAATIRRKGASRGAREEPWRRANAIRCLSRSAPRTDAVHPTEDHGPIAADPRDCPENQRIYHAVPGEHGAGCEQRGPSP
ncbi:hypothetical protein LJK88_00780 [Paenibacillus sp. P26]|nr:hypothetical protein LJK88_00780 [Paenibacillus sp. P26]